MEQNGTKWNEVEENGTNGTTWNSSFVMHSDYIEFLPEENKSMFLMYIYNYCIKGENPDITGFELSTWKFIKSRLDKDLEHFREVKNARSEAGKKHKGNQYSRNKMEQNGTTVEQNGTNGTLSLPLSLNSSLSLSLSSPLTLSLAREREIKDWGDFQKLSYAVIKTHNEYFETKIPVSGSVTYIQKECRYILDKLSAENPQEVFTALLNYIEVAETKNSWKNYFTLPNFLKEYASFTQSNFELEKYVKKSAANDEETAEKELEKFLSERG